MFGFSGITSHKTPSAILLIALMSIAAGCGWVDSTGVSAQTGTANADFGVAPASNGENSATPIEIDGLRVVQLLENSTVRLTPRGQQDSISDWTWTKALRNEAFPDCASVSGFDESLAADTLSRACTSDSNCALSIEHSRDLQARTVFDVTLPSLISPVGLSYRLTTYDTRGQSYNEYYSFCGISINEAPLAGDDNFSVIRGESKVVSASDPINLLTNDVDDIDIRNMPLTINTTAISPPQHASSFSLRHDGGFSYTADRSAGAPNTTDSFVYEVSDGLHTSQATVTLRIVDSGEQPQRLGRVPNLSIYVDEPVLVGDSAFDLTKFYADADNDALSYRVISGSLPVSGNLILHPTGYFLGTADANDIGDYTVTVIVSDGVFEISDTFTLSILPNPSSEQNTAPFISPLEDKIYSLGDRINVRIEASDADGDRLQFNLAEDSATFISINRNSGRISGIASQTGVHRVTIVASDGTSSISRMFFIRVIADENNAPLVDDISNRIFNSAFSYDVSVFFEDPDGDSLSYTAVNLPESVSISRSGVIQGVPTNNNTGPHFIQVTADDGRSGTVTDGFLLTIN